MELRVLDPDPEHTDKVCAEILRDFNELPPNILEVSQGEHHTAQGESNRLLKGDPITIGTIVISLAASGALTAALSKGGFLTTLASALERYISRTTKLKLVSKDGREVTLEGPSSNIETILREALQHDSRK